MKKITIFLFSILFISGCYVDRKGELTKKGINFINDHCKGSDSVSVSDKIETSVDTVKIPYPVQGPIQYLENPCKKLCDSLGNLKQFSVTKKTNGITGTIKSVGNSIAFDCHTDSLMMIIETQKRLITTYETQKIVTQKPCDKEHITGWDQYWIKTGYILAAFMALQILLKIVTSIYPVTKPFLGLAYLFKF